MNITIKQELEKFIQQQIKSGKYESVDRVIEEALNLLEKREQYDRWVEEVREKIDIAATQLDRGQGVDGESVIEQMRQKLSEAKEA
ncbi:MAG: type II toxin-antitoxin system ParD family antitoxin [Waterburya sp.]